MASASTDIDNALIAALASRLLVLERQIERLARYTWHAEDCAVNEGIRERGYPCTCGLAKLEKKGPFGP